MVLLREIDTTLLESDVLASLLLLDRRPGSEGTAVGAIDEVGGRIFGWLLDPARRQATDVEIKTQRTLQQRQLRALLHVVDSASTDFGDDQPRRLRVRSRWAQVCHELVAHVRQRPGTPLDRATIATVARSLDALVRDGAAEIVDVLLYVATLLPNPQHLQICAEASMQPDASGLLRRYAELARGAAAGADTTQNRLHALRALLGAFPSQTTLRAETVRTTAERLVRALEGVLATGSLEALVPEDDAAAEVGPLGVVEAALAQLQQLVAGAERRCSERVSEERAAALDLQHGLCSAVEHAVSTGSIAEVLAALGAAARAAHRALPPAFAVLVAESLSRLAALPAMPAEPLDLVQPVRSQRNPLPGWMPASRILGGFYVLHQLGGGNVGTVFVAVRAERRHDPEAERFALKVPAFNATAARALSEQEFLRLFREEAGALLAIPEHLNLARLISFDAGAQPKPILVMELVEGPGCDRVVAARSLSAPRALAILDGILGGLEAMHAVGIAHLDLKPSNVILREAEEPVLVDFGLAGRKLRPGCGTLCYGAPEVWNAADQTASPAPAADVYAFGCAAFELLTATTLFDGPNDVAIIAAHVSHDGLPRPVETMARHGPLQALAMCLFQCLRQDPRKRATVSQLRRELGRIAPELGKLAWPLRIA
ncbi:MAG: serine/threonine protein kinase [Deltaproteobacteria bacterium]|nr:serine/threonine protein kinase [Deltaproteobacteria bacterium]